MRHFGEESSDSSRPMSLTPVVLTPGAYRTAVLTIATAHTLNTTANVLTVFSQYSNNVLYFNNVLSMF